MTHDQARALALRLAAAAIRREARVADFSLMLRPEDAEIVREQLGEVAGELEPAAVVLELGPAPSMGAALELAAVALAGRGVGHA